MSEVVLYMYDLTNGMAAQFSQQMLGMHIEAIWHTSVVVFGREFYFDGGVGITAAAPGSTRFGRPLKTRPMGTTEVAATEFAQWVRDMGSKYGPADYKLLERNCNHFTDDALQFLVGHAIDPDVATMIDRVMGTPLGQMMRPNLEMMTAAPQQQQPAASMAYQGPQPTAIEEKALGPLTEALAATEDVTTTLAAAEVVSAVLRNCMAHPTEDKYASINWEGNAMAPVRSTPSAVSVLDWCGFVPEGGRLVLQRQRASRAHHELAAAMLQGPITELKELKQALEASA